MGNMAKNRGILYLAIEICAMGRIDIKLTGFLPLHTKKNEDLRNKCIFSEPKRVASSVLIVRTNKQAINHL